LPAGEVARDWLWHRVPEQLTFDEIEAELAACSPRPWPDCARRHRRDARPDRPPGDRARGQVALVRPALLDERLAWLHWTTDAELDWLTDLIDAVALVRPALLDERLAWLHWTTDAELDWFNGPRRRGGARRRSERAR
jgi:hypothetical protein